MPITLAVLSEERTVLDRSNTGVAGSIAIRCIHVTCVQVTGHNFRVIQSRKRPKLKKKGNRTIIMEVN